MFRILFLIALALGLPLDAAENAMPDFKPTRVLTYKTIGNRNLELHVFEPEGFKATDSRPCFVAIHGGGWISGTPAKFYPFAAHFAKRGYVGISLQYRLASKKKGGASVINCVKDGRSAIRYIRRHAAELGIDPQRIVASGGSAGGHVAAGTALFDGMDEAGDDTQTSCVPNALALYYPVIDTSTEGYGNAICGERWRKLSPAHRVKPGAPPTIIFHGTADKTTPLKGARKFERAMREAGNRCELVVHEGGGHGYMLPKNDPVLFDEAMRRTEEFLKSLGWGNP